MATVSLELTTCVLRVHRLTTQPCCPYHMPWSNGAAIILTWPYKDLYSLSMFLRGVLIMEGYWGHNSKVLRSTFYILQNYILHWWIHYATWGAAAAFVPSMIPKCFIPFVNLNCNFLRSTSNFLHSMCNFLHSIYNFLHSTCNFFHSTCSIYATFFILHATFFI